MDIDLDISQEELFVYYVNQGKSKAEAYRRIRDCSGLKKESIHVLAFRFSMKPQVVHLMSQVSDNSYADYIDKRKQVLENLKEISLNGDSSRAMIDASATFLQHTSKLTKLDINVTNSNNEANLLEELRSVLLETPHSLSSEKKKSLSNNFEKSQKFPVDNEDVIDVEPVPAVTFEGKEATLDDWYEQFEGINPTYAKGTTDRDTGSNTGNFRDGKTGRFLPKEESFRILSELAGKNED